MELKEMIKVMQHFANGGLVEYAEIGSNEWSVANIPCWSWSDYNYRIKEQKVVTIEKWLCQVSNNDFVIVETSAINRHRAYKKVKLIESYQVEL